MLSYLLLLLLATLLYSSSIALIYLTQVSPPFCSCFFSFFFSLTSTSLCWETLVFKTISQSFMFSVFFVAKHLTRSLRSEPLVHTFLQLTNFCNPRCCLHVSSCGCPCICFRKSYPCRALHNLHTFYTILWCAPLRPFSTNQPLKHYHFVFFLCTECQSCLQPRKAKTLALGVFIFSVLPTLGTRMLASSCI